MGRSNPREESSRPKRRVGAIRYKKKACPLCKLDVYWVDYKNVNLLKKFINEKGKLKPRRQTGCCAIHQDQVSVAVKNAREIMLLSAVNRGGVEKSFRYSYQQSQEQNAGINYEEIASQYEKMLEETDQEVTQESEAQSESFA